MNLSNKGFTKNICKIFLKNLKFVQSLFKKTFYGGIYDSYRRTKLKGHFKDSAGHQHLTEDEIFKKPSSKTWVFLRDHYTVETFTEATNHDLDTEI